jgi:SAM-dependent methyltransferase
MNSATRQSRDYFESLYRLSDDPWRFATSAYERQRYLVILDGLSRTFYRRGWEPGCSVGVLTAALALRVQSLVASDISDAAVALAKERCRGLAHVQIQQGDLVEKMPEGVFDLMVFSELGYYFSVGRLKRIALEMAERLEPGGEFVAVHWLGTSADHVLHGDEVHEVLAANLPCESIGGSRHAGFRIDAWRRAE